MNILKDNFKKYLVIPIYTAYILVFELVLGCSIGDPWDKLVSWGNR